MFFSSYLQGTLKQLSIHAEFGEGRVKVKIPPPHSEHFRTVDTHFNINVVHKILIVHMLSSAFVACRFEGAL